MFKMHIPKETVLYGGGLERLHDYALFFYHDKGHIGEQTPEGYVPVSAEKLIIRFGHDAIPEFVQGRHWILINNDEHEFPPSPDSIAYKLEGRSADLWDWTPDFSKYSLVQIEISERYISSLWLSQFAVIVRQTIRLEDVASMLEQTAPVSLPSHLFGDFDDLRSTEDGLLLYNWADCERGQDSSVSESFVIGLHNGEQRLILSGYYPQRRAPSRHSNFILHNAPLRLHTMPLSER